MVAPFRCVDEINQGLDERNERLVFKRIVENSTKPPGPNGPTDHCGQYWLITPKLLPNLTDMEREAVNVLCIYNGMCLRWDNVDVDVFQTFIVYSWCFCFFDTGAYNLRRPREWNVSDLVSLRKRPRLEDGVKEEED